LVYFNQEISGTFDPQFVFIYSSIALAIFLVLVRSQPKGNVLYHPTFVKITLALMIGCIPGAFYLKWKGFVDPPQERDLRMLESRIDSLLDKLEEKGVITTDEASVLRQ